MPRLMSISKELDHNHVKELVESVDRRLKNASSNLESGLILPIEYNEIVLRVLSSASVAILKVQGKL